MDGVGGQDQMGGYARYKYKKNENITKTENFSALPFSLFNIDDTFSKVRHKIFAKNIWLSQVSG